MHKLILIMTFFTFSSCPVLAAEYDCAFENLSIRIIADKLQDIELKILEDGNTIATCQMKVISYDDGKLGASIDELIRFKKIACNTLRNDSNLNALINDSGFLKISSLNNLAAAGIISNKNTLKCRHNKTQ